MEAKNALCHWEIPSTDFDRSKAFYEGLFGWKVRMMPEMDYAVFMVDGGMGGGFNRVETISNDGIQVYVMVEDIEATLARAEKLGGRVVKPKTMISEQHGHYAFLQDSCGAQLGLWSRH